MVIVGMVLLGLIGAGTAWVRRYYEDDQVRERFGPNVVLLMATAPKAMAICRVGETERGRIDVSKAIGFSNIRYMLGRDFAYRIDPSVPPPSLMLPTPWAIQFEGTDGGTVRLGFSYDCKTALLEEGGGASVDLVDAAADELRKFFHEQFAEKSQAVDKLWQREQQQTPN